MKTSRFKSMNRARLLSGLILLAMFSVSEAQTLKIATVVPEGSGWMVSMRAGAAEISERTEGRVKFKFYAGGVQGNDKQVQRKMRIGQLHGGAFTPTALAIFQKDAQLYSMPMLFNNQEEVDFVRGKMDHKLHALLEQAGYIDFGFGGGGFAHLMSNDPIANLEDMKSQKVWIPDGDKVAYDAIQTLGVSPVAMPITDVLTGLQTELLNAIMGPPAGTIIMQWNTGVKYITELPLAYIYAALVVEKKYFDKIQPADQLIVREVMEGVYQGFDKLSVKDNEDAYQALLDDGLKPVTPDQGQFSVWREAVSASNHTLADEGLIDKNLLLEIECYLSAHRSGDMNKDCSL